MRTSSERFLTTHTGSLPRPDDLVRMMYAKEEGVPVERDALAARVASAVAEVVGKQVQAGVDIVNDGEMSKPSYATYIKDRLSGFGGEGNTFVYQDLADFPKLEKRVFGDPGRSRRKTPACNAAIGVRDPRRPGQVAAVLPLEDVSISTSGDYERYFDAEGTRFHHLIDPATGKSPREIQSVTILADDGLTCEALSKIVFVLGVERGMALVETQSGVDAVVVDAAGALHFSSGLLAPPPPSSASTTQ